MPHISVLPKEVEKLLEIKEGEVFVDATLGSAGHALKICRELGKSVEIIGIDQDKERVAESKKNLEKAGCKARIIVGNFRDLDKILNNLDIKGVDKILFDLGLNTEQLENSNRGFSFQKNEPLLMNFGENPKFTAREIVNEWSKESIEDILWGYGEEKFSRQIAEKITETRKSRGIETTSDLVEVIEKAIPNWYKHKKIHFATKTFQALRIAVNDEIEALKEGIQKGFERLNSGGRMAVISFQGTEDRYVKRYFRELKNEGKVEILTKKPVTPQREEIQINPKSRSAKLRVVKKIR